MAAGNDGSDIELVLHAQTDEVSKNTAELIKLIDSLSKSLDGIDGKAAAQLKDQLANLADVIKSMDLSKLQSLDGILEKMKETKVKLTPEGIEKVGKQLDAVAVKAKQVHEQVKDLGLNVSIEQGDNTDEDVDRKIGAMGNAEALINSIKEYREKLKEVGGDYSEIEKRLKYLTIVARNAGPKSLDHLKAATDNVTESFNKLGSQGQKAVASIQQSVMQTSKALSNNIKRPIKEIEGVSTETFTGANAMTSLLSGNFSSIASQMMDLLKKTKLWENALGGAGAKVGVVGAAFAFAMYGINKAIEGAKRMVSSLKERAREREQTHWDNEYSGGEAAKSAMWRLEERNLADANNRTRRDAEISRQRAARDAERDAEDARIAARKNAALAGNFNAGSVETITNDYEDTMAMRGLERERTSAADNLEDLRRKEEDVKKEIDNLSKAQESLKSNAQSVAAALQRAIEHGEDVDSYGSQVLQNLADLGWGRSQDEVMDDAKKYIDQGFTVSQMISDYQQGVRRDLNAKKAELAAVGSEIEGAKAKQSVIAAKIYEDATRRHERDSRIRHERDVENRAKDYEDAMYNRGVAEEEEQRQIGRDNETTDFTTRQAAAKKRLADRQTAYDRALRDYNAFMDSPQVKGKDERKIGEDLKVLRGKLEERLEHTRQRLASARDEDFSLKRDAGSGEYSRARGLAVERRDEMEADRAQARAWRTRMYGAAGREADAQGELDYQRKLLKDRTGALRDFVRSAGGSGLSLTDAQLAALNGRQRSQYEDLRSDMMTSRGGVRSATGAYMDALWEGNQRDVNFRNGLKESNRLTSMGLAGGGTMKWGVDTASNTKEMVRLQRELNNRLAKETKAVGNDSATYTF